MFPLLIAEILIAIVPAVLPRPWSFLGYGVFWLIAGLTWLERHVQPTWEDNDRFGLGEFIFGIWLTVGLIGFLSLFLSKKKPRTENRGPTLWPFPIGILLAVFAMHWVSNQVAGVTPAWLVHVSVASGALGAGFLFWRFRPRIRLLCDLSTVAVVASVVMALLVAKSAIDALLWSKKARETAKSAPYCMLTFAGREHRRPATNVLELSPLVSRSGGRSFIDDASWLVVAQPDGVTITRWRSYYGRPPYFEDQIGPADCTPKVGGNFR